MLRLGVIGLSKGNGHPYSWSAIFNGYDADQIELCGFPVIPQYLAEQSWPAARIQDANVKCVWTQDRELSKKIAAATLIEEIVDSPSAMIEKIDGLLLARDDAENHRKFAEPFLRAGKPVFIDKPIALSTDEFNALHALEQYPMQVFTCSALRYSKELKLTDEDKLELGEIREIHAVIPNSWEKYAVHIIEPVLLLLNQQDQPVEFAPLRARNTDSTQPGLSVEWKSGVITRFFTLGDVITPISIRVYGTGRSKELVFSGTFAAFKAALQDFVDGVKTGSIRLPRYFNQRVVELIEAGRRM